jgi:hypothetical protein
MRIREENCNMVLLATVTAFSLAVAGIVAAMEPEPLTRRAEAAPPAAAANQTAAVRMIGTPFVPNTNPRER